MALVSSKRVLVFSSPHFRRRTSVLMCMLLMIMALSYSASAQTQVYVDDDWVGTTPGTDPDAGGPATNFGFDSFGAIQDGINGVLPGGTVTVRAGTYSPAGTIGINKSITLEGPNAAISPNGGSRVAEAVITGGQTPSLRVSLPGNATIQGFKFDATGVLDGYDPGMNITLRRNIFSNMTSQTFFYNAPALLTFDDNYLTSAAPADEESLFIAGDWNGTTGTAVSITNNVWENSTSTAMNLSSVSGTISGNRVTNVRYYGILLANSSGSLSINNNTFDGIVNPNPAATTTWGAGVRFYTPSFVGLVQIKSNIFKNSYVGVGVRATSDITGQNIHVNLNSFVNNTYGIRHDGAGLLDGENNWWGCNYGPGGTGAGCSGTPNGASGVGPNDSNPWLTLRTSATPTVLGIGGTSTVTSTLIFNSNNVDTTGLGTVKNGIASAFVGTLGTMAPPTGATASGITSSVFTATTFGSGNAATTIDGQTVNAAIAVDIPCVGVSVPTGLTTLRNVPVSIPINATDTTGRGIISYDFTYTYNPSTLTFTGIDQTGTLSSGMTVTINNSTPGTILVSGFQANTITGPGVLLKLNFNPTGPIGSTSALGLPSFMFNETPPCSTPSNGNITIISGTVSGVVSYANAPTFTPVPNTVLSAPGSPNVSGNSTFITGAYSLSGFGPGSYTVTPSKVGDVNGITAFDSGLIAQYVVNLIPLNATQLQAADVSQAAGVTSFDAGLIARYVVNLTGFGITGDWRFNPASRFYSSLETNQTNQDYSGILMGEVSGNWTAPTSFAPSAQKAAAAPEAVATVAQHFGPKQDVNRGELDVTIPIDTSDLSFATTGVDVISYQFILTYDPAFLTPRSPAVTVGGTLSENGAVTINQLTPGVLEVDFFRAMPLEGPGTLFNFRFNVTATAPQNADTILTWQTFQFNEGNPGDATTNVTVHVRGTTSANVGIGGRLLTAYGQPVSNTRVTITDVNGVSRSTQSSSLGYYRFEEVTVGQTYFVTVKTRRYRFQPMAVSVSDELTELNLIAEPE